MLQLAPPSRIFVATPPVDFSKGIASLAAICRQGRHEHPLSGAVFGLRNRSATALKILCDDGQGFWLCLQRLSQGHCTWGPPSTAPHRPLCARDLLILLWNGKPERAAMAADGRKGTPKASPGHSAPATTPPGSQTPRGDTLVGPPSIPPRSRQPEDRWQAGW